MNTIKIRLTIVIVLWDHQQVVSTRTSSTDRINATWIALMQVKVLDSKWVPNEISHLNYGSWYVYYIYISLLLLYCINMYRHH